MIRLLTVALMLLPGASASAFPERQGQMTTFRCRFTTGARAGEIQDFSSYANVLPVLIGFPCQDGQGNAGVAISNASDDLPPPPSTPNALPAGVTYTCKFTKGPQAGASRTFIPPAMPFAVGSDCADGAGSAGLAVVI